MGIGAILQDLIEQKGTNVNAVSVATGVNAQTIYSMIKRDNMKASITDLDLLARHLGVDLDYFCMQIRPGMSVSPEEKKKAPSVSDEALRLAQDYDELDNHGKRIVRVVTDEEKVRIATESKTRREQLEVSTEMPIEQKTPIPVSEDGLDDSDEGLMGYLQRMNPDLKKYWFDQMRKMLEPQKETSTVSAPPTADDKAPKSERPDRS